MNPDRFTIKSQEAIQAAQRLADERRNPQVTPEHLLAVLLEQDGGIVGPVLPSSASTPSAVRAPLSAALDGAADARRGWRGLRRRVRARPGAARRREGDARAEGRVRLHRAPAARAGRPRLEGRRGAARRRRTREALLEALQQVRGSHRVTDARPRGQAAGAGEVRRRPDRARRGRQARPGHRPRRRDPPRHPGAQPPHEEQPRPDRRARRRQDRDRRGPRPADRQRRRPRVAARSARRRAGHRRADRRREVPRRVRGPAEGRPQGGRRGRAAA